MTKIVFTFYYMQPVVDFAMQTLRDRSPVGTDPHAGLYRDSHMIFLDGHVVADVGNWQPGQQVEISNPVPYSRKIEVGAMKVSVPPHVYEGSVPLIAAKFPAFSIQFVFMPVSFSSNQTFSHSKEGRAFGKKRSPKALRDWLARQPALIITTR